MNIPPPELDALAGILVAAVCGGAVGMERQRSGHADGNKHGRFAGFRTFTLLGILSGVAGWMWRSALTTPATVLLAGGALLISVAYFAAAKRDVDGTTEVAALVVLAAGYLSGLGHRALGSGLIAVTLLLLAEKTRLHRWVARVEDAEFTAGVRFAVMAAVILPVVPTGPFGPAPGIRPKELWLIVLVITGLEFAGYVARRRIGHRYGYTAAGLLGGLISSTSVTLSYARVSREHPSFGRALASGAIAANAALMPRVFLTALVLNPELARSLLPHLVGPFLILVVALIASLHTHDGAPNGETPIKNPMRVGAALQLASIYQGAIYGIALAQRALGATGLFTSGLLLGMTDIDALTISLARQTDNATPTATLAQVIAVGIIGTTAVKLSIALAIGRGQFRLRVAVPFALMFLALGTTLFVLR